MNIPSQIWARSEVGSVYVAVLNRKTDRWEEQELFSTTDAVKVMSYQPVHHDLFFSVRRFDGRRLNKNATPTMLLYADLDGIDPADLDVRPSIAWSTTPGTNYQAVWYLTKTMAEKDWAHLNQAMTYKIKADKGGWHASKMLRVPCSTNWKRGGLINEEVFYRPNVAYEPSELIEYTREELSLTYDEATHMLRVSTHPDIPDPKDHTWLLRLYWPRLSELAKNMLVKMRVQDRSMHIIRTLHELKACGLNRSEAWFVIFGTPFNKFRNRPDRLWSEIESIWDK